MAVNKGDTVHSRAAWNSISARKERKCAICGNVFMATQEHRYKINDRWMCSYTCFRRAQNRDYRPVSNDSLKERERCLTQIVEKTQWMIAAKTTEERRAASSARTKWLRKLEEVERYGG